VKFKIDENLPKEFAQHLRPEGFDAETVSEEKLSGKEDVDLFERCQEEGRILITLDLDFANVRAYPPSLHAGIIVFRPRTQDKPTLISLLRRFIPLLQKKSPNRQLWIVEADRIRYRED
jgi:predicted nuclease of predicted toxin-antitoxin system